ncbi:hypothetical protein SETAZ057_11258 [Salmonella enterica subsp. enterica serovar Typhimurium str. AZ 057]|nr:hypothetical protein SETAZ057_11258 [Salmonella enterica subsp. enterica serovar Typhimurium str. AZ 057]
MFVLKKIIFAIFSTMQTKKIRMFHHKITRKQVKRLFIIHNAE